MLFVFSWSDKRDETVMPDSNDVLLIIIPKAKETAA